MKPIRTIGAAFLAALALNSAAQTTIRDIRGSFKVDTNTIAIPAQDIRHAIQVVGDISSADAEALAKAVQAGQEIKVLSVSSNGWVVTIADMVETSDASVPGTLFLGGRIFGQPRDADYILLDGCDFYYNRAIPGDPDPEAGLGNIVTDAYLDWWLSDFYLGIAATNRAMYEKVMEINDLPATLGDELYAYAQATGTVSQAAQGIYDARDTSMATMTSLHNEMIATNRVIKTIIENALAQAEGGGAAWTHTTTSSSTITMADHQNTTCTFNDYTDYGITIIFPQGNGTCHFRVAFTCAADLGYNYGTYINFSTDGSYTGKGDYSSLTDYDPYYGETQYFNTVVFDIYEYDVNCWMIRKDCGEQYYP
ncbi:MAG: hypothetical protein J6T14_07120 [Clostridia bacterium]|nr:hypothetical protein [Clostridia bacterium]